MKDVKDLHPIHKAVVRLETYAEDRKLETATGFFLTTQTAPLRMHVLVTNWHVLAGRNPLDVGFTRDPKGAIPDNVRLFLLSPESQGDMMKWEGVTVPLYDENDQAYWQQHPRLGHRTDVAILPVGTELSAWLAHGLNDIATAEDMAVSFGSEIFVVGYPLGFSHFAVTPIWKRGSIASDPHMGDENTMGRVVIDATTREGMSGSPVVLKAQTHYASEAGAVIAAPGAMRLIGVYSSRPLLSVVRKDGPEDDTADLAYFIKSSLLVETIRAGTRGPRKFELPD